MYKARGSEFAMFLAVLPKYRAECIGLLRQALDGQLKLFVSGSHLDDTVKTGIPEQWFEAVKLVRVGKVVFVQYGSIFQALQAQNLIVDLNPRSLSAWLLLASRKILRKRTLVWGHIHPQSGPSSPTAPLRLQMRRLSSGSVSYTYTDRSKALMDLPGQPVWVAPNSLYRESDIRGTGGIRRNEVLYVGRLEPAKKPQLLVRAFAVAAESNPKIKLTLVGTGSETDALKNLVAQLGLEGSVTFAGWIDDVAKLRDHYARAFCSVSPGFAGLGLTQSLGFGVPMIVADKENHSPEIELASSGGVTWFTADSASSLAEALLSLNEHSEALPDESLSEKVRNLYSAEAMASGLQNALENILPIEESKP